MTVKKGTLKQIDHLYDNLDASFRGFRQSAGRSDHSGSIKVKEAYSKTNWENTKNSDADAARFNSTTDNDVAQSKTLKSFDKYLASKKKRLEEKTKKLRKLE